MFVYDPRVASVVGSVFDDPGYMQRCCNLVIGFVFASQLQEINLDGRSDYDPYVPENDRTSKT